MKLKEFFSLMIFSLKKKKQNKKTDEGDIGHNTSARQPTRKETLAGFPGVS